MLSKLYEIVWYGGLMSNFGTHGRAPSSEWRYACNFSHLWEGGLSWLMCTWKEGIWEWLCFNESKPSQSLCFLLSFLPWMHTTQNTNPRRRRRRSSMDLIGSTSEIHSFHPESDTYYVFQIVFFALLHLLATWAMEWWPKSLSLSLSLSLRVNTIPFPLLFWLLC